jgi:hypothetical protein
MDYEIDGGDTGVRQLASVSIVLWNNREGMGKSIVRDPAIVLTKFVSILCVRYKAWYSQSSSIYLFSLLGEPLFGEVVMCLDQSSNEVILWQW